MRRICDRRRYERRPRDAAGPHPQSYVLAYEAGEDSAELHPGNAFFASRRTSRRTCTSRSDRLRELAGTAIHVRSFLHAGAPAAGHGRACSLSSCGVPSPSLRPRPKLRVRIVPIQTQRELATDLEVRRGQTRVFDTTHGCATHIGYV
jgi:hypothetical protein